LQEIGLEDSLDLDLGLDSLGLAELFARLDRAFDVRLPERLLSEAETPADLWRALLAAGAKEELGPREERASAVTTVAERPPLEVDTLQGVLDWHLERCPEEP